MSMNGFLLFGTKIKVRTPIQVTGLPEHLCWVPMQINGSTMRSIGLPDNLFNVSSSVNYFVCKNILELINRSKRIPRSQIHQTTGSQHLSFLKYFAKWFVLITSISTKSFGKVFLSDFNVKMLTISMGNESENACHFNLFQRFDEN